MSAGHLPHFERLHRQDPDPWAVDTDPYERCKRAHALSLLPRQRYGRAYEPGCSIGALTAELADRCDHVLATDGAEQAVLAARRRLARHPHVEVRRGVLPDDWPAGAFELVVCSEVLYYLDVADTEVVLEHLRRSLVPGGTLLAVHWRGRVPETGRDGDEVHAQLAAAPGFTVRRTAVTDDYRCAVHDRVDPADEPA